MSIFITVLQNCATSADQWDVKSWDSAQEKVLWLCILWETAEPQAPWALWQLCLLEPVKKKALVVFRNLQEQRAAEQEFADLNMRASLWQCTIYYLCLLNISIFLLNIEEGEENIYE